MAATLVHIKSRMMLPGRKGDSEDQEEDPREELVISLLRYKRCKLLAGELKTRHDVYTDCYYRVPSTAKAMDVEIKLPPQEFVSSEFDIAVSNVCKRNEIRFADISAKITHILKKDKKIDRIVGFLAVLELLRGNKITAQQKKPFDVILIEDKGMVEKS